MGILLPRGLYDNAESDVDGCEADKIVVVVEIIDCNCIYKEKVSTATNSA